MGSFAEVFPAANVRHHFVGIEDERGIYAKELDIPAGMELVSHRHLYDHLSILAVGTAVLEVDGKSQTLIGPCAVTIRKGDVHALRALTNVKWYCIHPTEHSDAALIDDVLIATGGA